MRRALVIIGSPGCNRGSEILLIGILSLLSKYGDYKCDISALSLPISWEQENSDLYCKIIPRETPYSNLWYKICNNIGGRLIRLGHGQLPTWFMRRAFCKTFRDYELIVFVGADNFDYIYTRPNELNSLISLAKKTSRAKVAIIDCSISKENINKFFVRNLHEADYVTARDSLSAENIRKYCSDVLLHADPAFGVDSRKCSGYIGDEKNCVGINLSPLVCEANSKVKNNIVCLIHWILDQTEETVLLIPHVMQQRDYPILDLIKQQFAEEERVVLLEDDKYTARELKYIISQCDAFVGARTHAMIAAYSSCVPALGIGYSIKSEGIAKDIFGDNDYCIQASEIAGDKDILDLFIRMWKERKDIKRYMQKIIPDYINSLKKLGELLL